MNPFQNLRKNTAVNFVGSALPLVVSIVTVPVYVRTIGTEQYGVLLLVWALLGYFGAFDLGLSRAVANKVAQLKDARPEARSQVVWTGIVLGLGVGVIGGAAMAGAGYLFTDRLLSISPDLRQDAVAGLVWLAVAVPLANAMWLLIGSLEGQEKFLSANAVVLFATVVSQAVPLVLGLLTDASLLWMLFGIASAALLGLLAALGVCARAVPLKRPGFDRALAFSLTRYGGWIMVTGIVSPILVIADRLVIGAVSGARAVTVYTVPYNLVNRLGILPLSLARTLFPRFSSLAQGDASYVQRRAIVMLAAVLTPVAVAAMFVLEPFLRAWIGADLAPECARVGQILVLGICVNAIASVPYTFLQGQGRPDVPAKFHMLEVIPYLAVLWAGLHYGGLDGAAWAWTGRVAIDTLLLSYAAALPLRELRTVAVGMVPLIFAYAAIILGGENDAVRIVCGVAITACSVAISLSLLRANGRPPAVQELRGDHEHAVGVQPH